MAFDIDQRMLVYLGMITAAIYFISVESPPNIPYLYQGIAIALGAIGGFLAYRKSRKKELGTKL
jgi:hypothetical protein